MPGTCWQRVGRFGAVAETIDERLIGAILEAGPKPPDSAPREVKAPYNNRLSNALALAIASELRERGLDGVMPSNAEGSGSSGSERRLAGGIGAKKVDVTWATEESGLILAASVKTIMFRDSVSKNFQKNLVNRRGDMLIEAVTLHRRFPYAVLIGLLFLDVGATRDGTDRRRSTFENAFPRTRLFTRRPDPAGREEQFERLYLLTIDTDPANPSVRAFEANSPENEIPLAQVIDDAMELVAERNVDLYEVESGRIRKL